MLISCHQSDMINGSRRQTGNLIGNLYSEGRGRGYHALKYLKRDCNTCFGHRFTHVPSPGVQMVYKANVSSLVTR